MTATLLAAGCGGLPTDGADAAIPAEVASMEQAVETPPNTLPTFPVAKHPAGGDLVRVLVSLRGSFSYEGVLTPDARTLQRETIRDAQDRIAAALGATTGKPPPSSTARITQRYTTVPGIALELTTDMLPTLNALPDVDRVFPDPLMAPSLDGTTGPALTDSRRANLAVSGPRGAGQVVAVLDTGIERAHSFLGASRFVDSACFSTSSFFGDNERTLCPNGEDRMIGGNAGEACSGMADCSHGTHVAGIIGGFRDDNGNGRLDLTDLAGVAPEVRFATIQVFHRENDATVCAARGDSTPCVRFAGSSVIAGLDHVETLKTDPDRDINVVAANLSLGGGSFTSQAVCDAVNVLAKWAIDDLRSHHIATVIASGNGTPGQSFAPGIAAPACISTAVSVGNTVDDDSLASNSQAASFLSLLAPGTSVRSSVTGGGFGNKSGTSMAAPHVAGAWALMREHRDRAGGSVSVGPILQRLKDTGKPIVDTRLNPDLTFRRLDVLAALGLPVVTLRGPTSITLSTTADFTTTYVLDRKNFSGALDMEASIDGAAAGDFTLGVDPDPATGDSVTLRIGHALHVAGTFKLHMRGFASDVRVFEQVTDLTIAAARPTITGFSPTTGPATTPVIINGSNFSRLTRVIFLGTTSPVNAQVRRVISPTQLEAIVPVDAQSGRIRVQNDVNAATSADSFTVTLVPVITSVVPSFAPVGAAVTVTGANFTPGTTVRIGALAVSELAIASSTRLTFRVPAGAATGTLRVGTTNGSDTADFTVGFPAPTLEGFAPLTGHAGQSMTIDGTGFFDPVLVRFGSVAATTTSVEHDRIRLTIPSGVPDRTPITVRTAGGLVTSTQVFQTDQ